MNRGLAALAISALSALCSCTGRQLHSSGKRVIVLGIDGMDPGLVERHWDMLPNLARLAREGCFHRLGTTTPPQSPVAWSTFATGTEPSAHGIYDFVYRNPATFAPFSAMAETLEPAHTVAIGPYVLPLSKGKVRSIRRGKVFWEILGERGIPAIILRMPVNFPPVECEGRALSGMGTPDLRGTFGTFAYYTDDPAESTRDVPGGTVVQVSVDQGRAALPVAGPVNTLRKDRPRVSVDLLVRIDPGHRAARFELGEQQFILREGEWSEWIPVRFPMIAGLKSAAGMLRVYAKKLSPQLGIYVSPVNIDPSAPELPISNPPSYSRELARALGPFATLGMPEDTAALRQGVFDINEYLRQSRMVAEEQFRLLRHALHEFHDGLLFFHFLGIDQDSHLLWGQHEDRLLETYRMVDGIIGEVKKSGPALLIVMSDHGFTGFRRAVHLNTWLWREGFLALKPGAFGSGELFAEVDWSRTRAYAFGLNGLYLNLAGRERFGIVRPGKESDAVRASLTDALLRFRDPDNNRQVVSSVAPVPSIAAGDVAPDLIVGYAPGYRCSWLTALGAAPPGILEDNNDAWIGDHCIAAEHVPGLLAANTKLRVADPRLADLTVTVLREFGIARPAGMAGRAIFK